jgi:ankyrin repeat protein
MNLHNAAEAGHLAEVQNEVARNPLVLNVRRWRPHGPTLLVCASGGGHLELVRWLLDQGAVIGTALQSASAKGHTPVVRLLLERGGDPTYTCLLFDTTPLIHAAKGGHVETVRCLLDHPSVAASINHHRGDGRTALWWAATNKTGEVVRALLEKTADPTLVCDMGMTPIARARRYKHRECLEELQVRPLLLFLRPTG